MTHVATLAGNALPHGAGLSDLEVIWFETVPYVYAGAFTDGGITRLRIVEGKGAEVVGARPGDSSTGTLGLNDLMPVEVDGGLWLIGAGRHDDRPALRALSSADGAMGGRQVLDPGKVATAGLTHLTTVATSGGDLVVASRRDAPGLQVFAIGDDFALDLKSRVPDGRKATVADVSGLLTLTVAGQQFVVAASASEAGITSFRTSPSGKLVMADSITAASGLGIAGVTALAALEVAGETFVIAGSGPAGAISVLRMNHLGVFFETDHMLDTLATRFGGVQDIATFTHNGRAFLLAGGRDDGIALLELGPGGRLHHLQSLANAPGWVLDGVQTVQAVVVGDEVQLFAAGSGAPGLSQFRIDLTTLGPLLTGGPGGGEILGTGRDDHLVAGSGDSTLRGGAGDDLLVDGPGADLLIGGPGADVFVFGKDGRTDRVGDFEIGIDRLDLSDWGRIHHHGDLDITSRPDGARIAFDGEVLILRTMDHMPLTAADFTDADFIFL